jgi:hypothetical protein
MLRGIIVVALLTVGALLLMDVNVFDLPKLIIPTLSTRRSLGIILVALGLVAALPMNPLRVGLLKFFEGVKQDVRKLTMFNTRVSDKLMEWERKARFKAYIKACRSENLRRRR